MRSYQFQPPYDEVSRRPSKRGSRWRVVLQVGSGILNRIARALVFWREWPG